MTARLPLLAGVLMLLPVAAGAQDCGQSIRALAHGHGLSIARPPANAATADAEPATSESLGVGVMDRLQQPDAVNRPAVEGSSGTATGPAPADGEARRIQAQALLNEARQDFDAGRTDDCLAKADAARALLQPAGR